MKKELKEHVHILTGLEIAKAGEKFHTPLFDQMLSYVPDEVKTRIKYKLQVSSSSIIPVLLFFYLAKMRSREANEILDIEVLFNHETQKAPSFFVKIPWLGVSMVLMFNDWNYETIFEVYGYIPHITANQQISIDVLSERVMIHLSTNFQKYILLDPVGHGTLDLRNQQEFDKALFLSEVLQFTLQLRSQSNLRK